MTGEQLRQLVNYAMEYLKDSHRGDLVSHETLESLSGIGRRQQSEQWVQFTQALGDRMLKERGIRLFNRWGEGYELVTCEDQLNKVPNSDYKKAIRRMSKAIKSVQAIPQDELTTHQRRIQAMRVESMRKARLELKRALREEKMYVKPKAATPNSKPPLRQPKPAPKIY